MKYYNQVRELTEQKDDLARLNFVLLHALWLVALERDHQASALSPDSERQIVLYAISALCVVNGNDPNLYIQRIAKCSYIGSIVVQRHIVQDDSMDEGEQQQAGIFSPLFSPLPVKVRAFKQKVLWITMRLSNMILA
jgi:hypothetical protein